jgi:hypothetical protein
VCADVQRPGRPVPTRVAREIRRWINTAGVIRFGDARIEFAPYQASLGPGLSKLFVVYPGKLNYPLTENIVAVGIENLPSILNLLREALIEGKKTS